MTAENETRKVVIAVDNSRSAVNAFAWATKAFLRPSDEVHVVTVVAPTSKSTIVVGEHALISVEPTSASEEDLERAEALLSQCKDKAKSVGLNNIQTNKLVGVLGRSAEVGNAINYYCDSNGADAVVIGSRGLGSISRSFLTMVGLGSISDYLVRHSTVPVVVHKATCDQ